MAEPEYEYVGKVCYGSVGTESENEAGAITAVTGCRLAGCSGICLCVRWPDGKRTRPCTKGCTQLPDGNWRIN